MNAFIGLVMLGLLFTSHIQIALFSYERGKATKVPKCPKCKKFYKVQESRLGKLYRVGLERIYEHNN